MSATDELKNMLLTFRVSELQMLLGYAGQNKTGRKTELQARAIDLIKSKSITQAPHIHAKIRELYRSIQGIVQYKNNINPTFPKQEIIHQPPTFLQGGTVVSSAMMEMTPHPPQSTAAPIITSSLSRGVTPQPTSQQHQQLPGFIPLTVHGSHGYTDNWGWCDSLPGQARTPNIYGSMYGYNPPPNITQVQTPTYPIQPDVTFKRLPFFDVLGELLKPSSLVPTNSQRDQGTSFFFYLTPQQASEIAINREVGPGTKNEYVVQVQMRFCLLETSCEQEDCFPPGLIVKVNGKLCQLPQGPVPINKPATEPKRPPRPLNISSMVKLCPSVANQVNVSWTPEYVRGYVIVVNLVRKLSAPDLLQRLKAKGSRHADFTTGLIKEKLSEDADSEIATTSLRVSLLCPLGKMRMGTPCRPSTCLHLQCFDAFLYIQMNEKKPTWTCPVCDKQALYDNLVIDGYFQEVLNSQLLPAESHEIQLHKDGSWSSHLPKKLSLANLGTPTKAEPIEEILDDVDDSQDCESVDEGLGSEVALKLENIPDVSLIATNVDKHNITTIDLTLSDSEDESDGNRKTDPPPRLGKSMDHAISDSSSVVSGGRSPPSIITLDSPSPPPRDLTPPSCALATTNHQGIPVAAVHPVIINPQPPQQSIPTHPQSPSAPMTSPLPPHPLYTQPSPLPDDMTSQPQHNYHNYLRMDSRYHPY